MTAKELIIKLMDEKGISYNRLSKRLGIKHQVLWSKIYSSKNTDLRINDAALILDKLGYRVAFIPKWQRVHAGEIVYGDEGNEFEESEFAVNNTLAAAMKYGGEDDNTAEH